MYPRHPGDTPERIRQPAPKPITRPARDMPGLVRASARLMYAGAVLSSFSLIYWGFTTDDPTVPGHANLGGPSIVLAVITASLWLWMAWATLRGKTWARPVSAALLGIGTLLLLGLPGISRIGWALSWLAGVGAVILLFRRPSNTFFAPPD